MALSEQFPGAPIIHIRPNFIWVLTVADGLFAGVFLLVASARFLMVPGVFFHPLYEATQFSIGQIAYWGALGLGICASSYLAWAGSRFGRNVLIALMTVYLGLSLVQNGSYLVWAAGEPLSQNSFIWRQVAEGVWYVLWLVANYWFLLGRRGREFYS